MSESERWFGQESTVDAASDGSQFKHSILFTTNSLHISTLNNINQKRKLNDHVNDEI